MTNKDQAQVYLIIDLMTTHSLAASPFFFAIRTNPTIKLYILYKTINFAT